GGTFPQRMIEDARARFQVLLQRPFDGNPDAPGRRFGMPGRSSERGGAELFGRGSSGRVDPPLRGRPFGRGAPGERPFRPAFVRMNNEILALVVVPPQPPFTFLLSRYAPTLGLVAIDTLIV